MNLTQGKKALSLGFVLLWLLLAADANFAQPDAPGFKAVFLGQEYFQSGRQDMTRYVYLIKADEMPSAGQITSQLLARLPRCPRNEDAAQIGFSFATQQGKSFKAFCGAPSREGLILFFALESSVVPPSWVTIIHTDPRPPNQKLKSNLLETTL